MYLKVFISSLIISIVLSAIVYLANPGSFIPPFASHFLVAFIAGSAVSLWSGRPSPQDTKRGQHAGKPLNEGRKETGSVKWFSPKKGFGFITRDNGEDIFVHFRSIMGNGHRVLREGQRVEFAVTESSKGLQAEEVSIIKQ